MRCVAALTIPQAGQSGDGKCLILKRLYPVNETLRHKWWRTVLHAPGRLGGGLYVSCGSSSCRRSWWYAGRSQRAKADNFPITRTNLLLSAATNRTARCWAPLCAFLSAWSAASFPIMQEATYRLKQNFISHFSGFAYQFADVICTLVVGASFQCLLNSLQRRVEVAQNVLFLGVAGGRNITHGLTQSRKFCCNRGSFVAQIIDGCFKMIKDYYGSR